MSQSTQVIERQSEIPAVGEGPSLDSQRSAVVIFSSAQRQKAGITGDLAAGKISPNEVMTVEGKGQLWYNTLHQAMHVPNGTARCRRPMVTTPFTASFL